MANHTIPKASTLVERHHGVNADGDVITLSVYRHTRAGHTHPDYYVVQYREILRRIDRSTRWTRQFTGPHAREHMEADGQLPEARQALEDSRVVAAQQGPRRVTAGAITAVLRILFPVPVLLDTKALSPDTFRLRLPRRSAEHLGFGHNDGYAGEWLTQHLPGRVHVASTRLMRGGQRVEVVLRLGPAPADHQQARELEEQGAGV